MKMDRIYKVITVLALATLLNGLQAPRARADAEALKVIVQQVKGMVQVRASDDDKWEKAKAGMELTQGAAFRTGPRSSVKFHIPPDQTCTLDRLGIMKVLQAIKQDGKVTTDLGLKYGETEYQIETGGDLEHESTIRSPNATLAVRGTLVRFANNAGFKPTARWIARGAEKVAAARHSGTFISGDVTTTLGGGPDDDTATGTVSTMVGSKPRSRRPRARADVSELTPLENNPQTIAAGAVDITKFETNRGELKIKVNWTEPIADLDLDINTVLSNTNVARTTSNPTTGTAGASNDLILSNNEVLNPNRDVRLQVFDNTGTPDNAPKMDTFISRNGKFPAGTYNIDVLRAPETGNNAAAYTVDVIRDDQVIQTFQGSVGTGERNNHQIVIPKGAQPPP